jgi:hypothetical protein
MGGWGRYVVTLIDAVGGAEAVSTRVSTVSVTEGVAAAGAILVPVVERAAIPSESARLSKVMSIASFQYKSSEEAGEGARSTASAVGGDWTLEAGEGVAIAVEGEWSLEEAGEGV